MMGMRGLRFVLELGLVALLASCANAPERRVTDHTAAIEEPSKKAATAARILSPETGKYYDIPVPPGLCPPDPADRFILTGKDRRHPDFQAVFVPCKLPENAPRRRTEISPNLPVPSDRTPETAIGDILSEDDASRTPAGKYREFSSVVQLDAAIRAFVRSADFGASFSRLLNRDEDVRFSVIRVFKDTATVQVQSLVDVDGHLFTLIDAEFLPLQDGGTPASDLYSRRVNWIRQIRASAHAPAKRQ